MYELIVAYLNKEKNKTELLAQLPASEEVKQNIISDLSGTSLHEKGEIIDNIIIKFYILAIQKEFNVKCNEQKSFEITDTLKKIIKNKDPQTLLQAYQQLAAIFASLESSNRDLVLNQYKLASKQLEALLGNEEEYNQAAMSLSQQRANFYFNLPVANLQEARENYLKAIQAAEKINIKTDETRKDLAECYHQLGDIYFQTTGEEQDIVGCYDKAISELQTLSQEAQRPDLIANCYLSLAKYYAELLTDARVLLDETVYDDDEKFNQAENNVDQLRDKVTRSLKKGITCLLSITPTDSILRILRDLYYQYYLSSHLSLDNDEIIQCLKLALKYARAISVADEYDNEMIFKLYSALTYCFYYSKQFSQARKSIAEYLKFIEISKSYTKPDFDCWQSCAEHNFYAKKLHRITRIILGEEVIPTGDNEVAVDEREEIINLVYAFEEELEAISNESNISELAKPFASLLSILLNQEIKHSDLKGARDLLLYEEENVNSINALLSRVNILIESKGTLQSKLEGPAIALLYQQVNKLGAIIETQAEQIKELKQRLDEQQSHKNKKRKMIDEGSEDNNSRPLKFTRMHSAFFDESTTALTNPECDFFEENLQRRGNILMEFLP